MKNKTKIITAAILFGLAGSVIADGYDEGDQEYQFSIAPIQEESTISQGQQYDGKVVVEAALENNDSFNEYVN